ncbi:hypothetical protein [Kineothrix sp. MB12-C1]|uniref:hypothetical protein n=1 Tax=Kineothrix sp. MB12-C1 TaxID=3070215 RepID=UPI0027D20160|nr:hypothetical protein [Kineothrix sp. MB12-C1]WMC92633.1 hypothetical protein RBB56_17715 [Kineothrix sp. MB12-C1]
MKENKRIIYILFIIIFIFLTITILYVKKNMRIYHNQEVYIYDVNESEIHVKGFPTNTGSFSKSYIIKNTDSLKILDQAGTSISFETLNPGNIFIFDYKGIGAPRANVYLNKGIYNVRLSDEIFNNKFWNVNFEDEKAE